MLNRLKKKKKDYHNSSADTSHSQHPINVTGQSFSSGVSHWVDHNNSSSLSTSDETRHNHERTSGSSSYNAVTEKAANTHKNGISKDHVAYTNGQIDVDSTVEILQNEQNDAKAGFLQQSSVQCSKHPGHKEFIPINKFDIHHLPPPYQNQAWKEFIKLKGQETVHISVNYTSEYRSDDFGFVDFKGTKKKRIGSGTAFIMNLDKTEDCNCSEIPGAHKVSGCFKVMTVAHVVYDDSEAQSAVIKFFYDDDNDKSTVVKARGVRVSHVDIKRNRSVVECRTHDLTLYKKLLTARQGRIRLIQESLAAQVNNEPMVVLISHPHGLSKHVSIGKLLNMQEEGEVKTTNDGFELIGCIMTYDTPTCPGTGGGSINLIGHGEVCSAFAPHCASKSDGKNFSGLGWTKYVKTMQLRIGN